MIEDADVKEVTTKVVTHSAVRVGDSIYHTEVTVWPPVTDTDTFRWSLHLDTGKPKTPARTAGGYAKTPEEVTQAVRAQVLTIARSL